MGAAVTVVAGLGFASLGQHSSIYVAAFFSFLTGIGLGLGSTSLVVLIQSIVSWNRRGVVTGANMFSRQLGSTLGVAVYGTLVNAALAFAFLHPPAALAGHLPKTLSAASLVLGHVSHLPLGVLQYIKQSLSHGIHRVFVGVLAVAILIFAAEWFLPKKAEPLEQEESA
jgi:hypothetical protein